MHKYITLTEAKMEQNADVDDSNATSKSILAIAVAAQKIEVYNTPCSFTMSSYMALMAGLMVGSLAQVISKLVIACPPLQQNLSSSYMPVS